MSGAALEAVPDLCRPCSRGQHELCTLHEKCACEECNPPVVVWEEPPQTRGGAGRSRNFTVEQVAACMANPGRWARIKDVTKKSTASSAANSLCKGKVSGVDPAVWEFAARSTGPSSSALYARYVGPS